WDVLSEGAMGLILLVPCDAPHEFPHAKRILEHVVSRHPLEFILGLTRTDVATNGWDVAEVAAYFDLPEQQVIAVHPGNAASARYTLQTLLKRI
ncbi:MAG: hypothetical protein ACREPC_09365, partial [Stenotrophomonas sp.]